MLVDKLVYDGLEFVRSSGVTNMFSIYTVAGMLKQFGYGRAYNWLKENREKYVQGVFEGFEPVDDMFSEDIEIPTTNIWVKVGVSILVKDKEKKMELSGYVEDVEEMLGDLRGKYGDMMSYKIIGRE